MPPMISRAILQLSLPVLVLAPPAGAADFSKTRVEAHKAAGNVWMLTGAGGDIGVSAGAALRDALEMLRTTRDIVAQRVAAGKTTKQVVAAGLPKRWKSSSWGFISTTNWLETLDRDLRW